MKQLLWNKGQKQVWNHQRKTCSFTKGQYVTWYPKEIKIRSSKFKLLWMGPYIVLRVLGNNMVLLRSMDEEEFLLINAHKLKPCIVRKEQQGEKPTIQEDTTRGDYLINLTVHPVEDHLIGVILLSYFRPPNEPQPDRLLFDQKFVSLYPSDERLLLQGEPGEVVTKVTYYSNEGLSL